MTPAEALQAICEAWNRLDNDALAALFAEDGVFEDPLNERTAVGPDDVREISGHGMAALSECEVTLSAVVERGDLVVDGAPFPAFEDFWPVLGRNGDEVGIARWAVYSYALGQNIAIALVDAAVGDADELLVRAPDGSRGARVHAIPFV